MDEMSLRKRSYVLEDGLSEMKLGLGPGGECECPRCGHRIRHIRGYACDETECPRCGELMFRLKPSLMSNFLGQGTSFLSEREYKSFVKRLVKRLYRENLLGKKMKSFSSRFRFAQIYTTT